MTNPEHTHTVRVTHNGIAWRLVCLCERSDERLRRERADAVRIGKARHTPERTRALARDVIARIDAELARRLA